MNLFFLLILIVLILFFLLRRDIGSLLCLTTIFPELIGIILDANGISGLNMIVRFSLFAVIFIICLPQMNTGYINLFNNPLTIFFYIFVFTLVLHNVYLIEGAMKNPKIATFQLQFFLRVFIPFLILLLTANKKNVLINLCDSIPIWGAFFIAAFLLVFGLEHLDFSDRNTIQEETGINSISLSRIAVIIAVPSLFYFLKGYSRYRFFHFIIFLFSLFLLILAGQRGTIIGAGFSALLFLIIAYLKQGKLMTFSIIIIAVVLISYIILSLYDFQILHRFEELKHYESFERYSDYGTAWKAYSDNNYLTGLGSMGYYYYTHAQRDYPHSFILELMCEYGIVGFLFSITTIIYGFFMSYKVIEKNLSEFQNDLSVIPLIWCSLLVSVLVSGNLISNATFLTTTAILILEHNNSISNNDEEDFFIEE